MTTVDITADLNDEDETGFVWTFLDEARDPAVIAPGAIVVAGTPDAPAVAEVVVLVTKPAGTVVHSANPPRVGQRLRRRRPSLHLGCLSSFPIREVARPAIRERLGARRRRSADAKR